MRRAVLACALLVASAACGKQAIVPRYAPGATGASITVTSPAFAAGTRIPVDHTCDGTELIPELVFSSPPDGTRSLVLVVDDPDASSGVFTHMIVFNVSPDVRKVPGGAELTGVGENARFGLNDFMTPRYSGPCPPRGEGHRYRFRVIALDTVLDLPEGAPRERIDAAMDGHILGEGSLMGHFAH